MYPIWPLSRAAPRARAFCTRTSTGAVAWQPLCRDAVSPLLKTLQTSHRELESIRPMAAAHSNPLNTDTARWQELGYCAFPRLFSEVEADAMRTRLDADTLDTPTCLLRSTDRNILQTADQLQSFVEFCSLSRHYCVEQVPWRAAHAVNRLARRVPPPAFARCNRGVYRS